MNLDDSTLTIVKEMAESYAREYLPGELPYFSLIWEQVHQQRKDGGDFTARDAFSALRLPFAAGRKLQIVTPQVIMTLEATLLDCGELMSAPTEKQTQEAIAKCAEVYGLSKKKAQQMGKRMAKSLNNMITNMIFSDGILPATEVREESSSYGGKEQMYALLWDMMSPPEGKPISETEFKRIVEARKSCDLLVCIGEIKEVYIKSSLQPIKWPFTGLPEMLLVHTLKHRGVAGDALYLWEHVWNSQDTAQDFRQKLAKAGELEKADLRIEINERTTKIRTMISKINHNFFKPNLGVVLKTRRTKQYSITPDIKYALIET